MWCGVVCVCVCMLVCVCVCVCVHVHACLCCVSVCVHMCIHATVHRCTHVCLNAHVCVTCMRSASFSLFLPMHFHLACRPTVTPHSPPTPPPSSHSPPKKHLPLTWWPGLLQSFDPCPQFSQRLSLPHDDLVVALAPALGPDTHQLRGDATLQVRVHHTNQCTSHKSVYITQISVKSHKSACKGHMWGFWVLCV